MNNIRSILLVPPSAAWLDQLTINRQWMSLGYQAPPSYETANSQFNAFVALLTNSGIEVSLPQLQGKLTADAVYVRDAAIVTPAAEVVLCRMGKPTRTEEPAVVGNYLASLGYSIVGTIEPPGTLEGGDLIWLDDSTLAVARSYRTNDAGVDQLRSILQGRVERIITVPLPHFRGPSDLLHLMSVYSPLGRKRALVYRRLLPVPFVEFLECEAYQLIDVSEDEFDGLACNVLYIGNDSCVLVGGNERTAAILTVAGLTVHTFDGSDICVKGNGGPTCLTLPLKYSM